MHKIIAHEIEERKHILKELTEFLEEASTELEAMKAVKEGYEKEIEYLESNSYAIEPSASDKMVWEMIQRNRSKVCEEFENDVISGNLDFFEEKPLKHWQKFIIFFVYVATFVAGVACAGYIYNFFK